MSKDETEPKEVQPNTRWFPLKTGNIAQIGSFVMAFGGFLFIAWQISGISKQLEIAELSTFAQVWSQCLDVAKPDSPESTVPPRTTASYLPATQSLQLIACFDLMRDIDTLGAAELSINLEAANKLSELWEDRLINALTADARQVLEEKEADCGYSQEQLERLRMDFVAWYMLVHPASHADLETAFDHEVVEHQADVRANRNVEHADRFLGLVAILDDIKKPCQPT